MITQAQSKDTNFFLTSDMSIIIIISLRHDTPVSVVYPKNSSDIWKVIWLMPYGVTYCESVFRSLC